MGGGGGLGKDTEGGLAREDRVKRSEEEGIAGGGLAAVQEFA